MGFLIIVAMIVLYLVTAGATHGYAKHRWPPKIVRRQVYVRGTGYEWQDQDDNSANRTTSTIFWPFYWILIWPFTRANEITFSNIEKHAAMRIARNKSRIGDIHATRKELEESNAELERAEVDLEQEIAKMK